MLKLQKIYMDLIKSNKDILFILRYHPGIFDEEKNEFFGLRNLDNIFISDKSFNIHYNISDLINISDLWIGYETTTAIEAWLLNKQTFLINPTSSNFVRDNVHKGSPIVKDQFSAQLLIDEFYKNGSISKFNKLRDEREKIIKNVIEFDDGKNYFRAAKIITELLERKNRKFYRSPRFLCRSTKANYKNNVVKIYF